MGTHPLRLGCLSGDWRAARARVAFVFIITLRCALLLRPGGARRGWGLGLGRWPLRASAHSRGSRSAPPQAALYNRTEEESWKSNGPGHEKVGTNMVHPFREAEARGKGIASRRFWNSVGRKFQTPHRAHARVVSGNACPFVGPFSARGSLAETEASQRLVVAIYLVSINYRSGSP